MYCNDEVYKGVPEKDLWKILLLGNYALRNLEMQHDNKNQPTQISTSNFCSDRRRDPTIKKHLINLGLITGSYRVDGSISTVDKEVEKLLGGYSKEPLFNTSGYLKKKDYSYSVEKLVPVTDLSEVYREISDLNAYEVIHVYLNQALYDFKMFKTTSIYRNKYGNLPVQHHRHDLKIYPVNALDTVDGTTLAANNEDFAKHHAREILTAAFGCRFKCISDDKEYMTKRAVNNRLEKLEDKLRILHRAHKELLLLQRKIDTLGEEALRKKLLDASLEYIHTKAPLWLNLKGMEEDSTKKELAMLICKGTSLTLEKTIRN
jgi:hypothetical protein